eukprot:CAMPEP_0116939460 /NCGR_PEP_ID=MMETSP0467-20121206/32748_1 /TAXON_ID=283647 /ORGANISM="Mesodinium pulex, Strain SPMC105" /LENGTH=66 /DNA_ID=CAMNT_0004621741 /DNA_START=223 /DNA_END=423 /DNA_ORIENTATION=-
MVVELYKELDYTQTGTLDRDKFYKFVNPIVKAKIEVEVFRRNSRSINKRGQSKKSDVVANMMKDEV